ncbi:MAG TPA: transcriptional regulator FilR1 domain-containing protein [Patescibacteria group bacterium]|nr:transcriptional regulator FilR1 domain-containing protein [Patescibacteria group bacterium]
MPSTESLCDLLFEVSNEDRLSILLQLQENPLNITNLAKKLDSSTQEVSRHVSRLNDVGLTERTPEGLYILSPYGELTLRQIQSLNVTSTHRDYFRTHTLTSLPQEYIYRLGELTNAKYIDNVMVAIHRIEETLIAAEEYILNLNVPYIASAFPLIGDAFHRGIEGRFIKTRNLTIPENMMEERQQFLEEGYLQKIKASGQYEERLLPDAPLILYMSEKEVAILTFPEKEGGYDFHGFTSDDEDTLRWCRDAFNHHWEKAKKNI